MPQPPAADPTVGSVTDLLDSWYPPERADSWDAVGTVCGDLAAPARRLLLAVDPVRQVVDEALAWQADLLVVHHPLLLRAVHGVAATTPKGRVVHDLVRAGVALHVCHTNADSPAGGVSESLALALGLTDLRPIAPDEDRIVPTQAMDKLVVFVPHEAVQAVAAAITDAGAGAIGDYDRCTFSSTGTGSFRPLPGAEPAVGAVGRVEQVPETRLETVLARHLRGPVVAAMRAAHPYEEPAFDLVELADPGPHAADGQAGARGAGRIGHLPKPLRLADFTRQVVAVLPATPSALRVAGDPDRWVTRVAVCGGAGDFLLDQVRATGVDVYVTSDLRHHPVSEFLEHAAQDPSTPAVVDVPHMAAEWTWLPRLAHRLKSATTVDVRVSSAVTDPWTGHLPMIGPAH